jgi:hypothetical protein
VVLLLLIVRAGGTLCVICKVRLINIDVTALIISKFLPSRLRINYSRTIKFLFVRDFEISVLLLP